MIRSLLTATEDVRLEADVHVVGAGIAGLLVATRLAKRGLRVVVTESGGEHQIEDTHPLNDVVHMRSVYDGAANGRFRCLGGTSTRWGGAMIPFLAADMAHEGPNAWPVKHADLLAYREELERIFDLPAGPYDAPEIAEATDGSTPLFLPRLAKWPSFANRNVAALLNGQIRSPGGPEIWLEATTTDFAFAPDGRLSNIISRAPNGRQLTVIAPETVIAAGAIESTRLLLLADRQHGDRIFAPDDVLGRHFHDHLSVVVGTVLPTKLGTLNRVAGFRFEGKAMRNLRFEPSESEAARAQLAPAFAHIGFVGPEGGGFDTVRDLFRQVQQRRLPKPATLLRLARAAPWLTRAIWWRYREQRLLYPTDAEIQLHMVIEQEPRAENRILLSPDRVDRYAQPLAAIDWAVGANDQARLTHSTDLFLDFWRQTTLGALGDIRRRPPGEAEAELSRGGGIYHPGGSVRMAHGPADGVLDGDLRTFRVPNLSVVATAAFPTGGGTNPTMMLMLAALRLADRLAGTR